jgi:hypothetical protein
VFFPKMKKIQKFILANNSPKLPYGHITWPTPF